MIQTVPINETETVTIKTTKMVHKFKNKVENFLFSEMPVDSMDYERYGLFFTAQRIAR